TLAGDRRAYRTRAAVRAAIPHTAVRLVVRFGQRTAADLCLGPVRIAQARRARPGDSRFEGVRRRLPRILVLDARARRLRTRSDGARPSVHFPRRLARTHAAGRAQATHRT